MTEGQHHTGPAVPEVAWNKVVEGVWVGGSEIAYPGGTFDLVVSVYDWHHDRKRWLPKMGTPHIVMPMLDAYEVDEHKVFFLAQAIEDFRKAGTKKVLVRCQAGLNRSSLIVATWMIRHQGYYPDDAIRAIRENRGRFALFNDYFVAWLRELEHR